MIAARWPAWFREKLGGGLPDDYVAWDLETSGFSMSQDVIWEIAHVVVKGRKVVEESSTVLNWQNHPVVPDDWLRRRAGSQAEQFAANGLQMRFDYNRLAGGRPPEEVLRRYHGLFEGWLKDGFYLAAHYGSVFDEAMFAANLEGFVGIHGYNFGDRLIDTLSLEKASQAPDNPKSYPRPGEAPRDYFKRLARARLGVKANLAFCFEKYGMAAKGVGRGPLHTALADSYCVHYLLEALRGDSGPWPARFDLPLPESVPGSSPLPKPPSPGVPPQHFRGQRRS